MPSDTAAKLQEFKHSLIRKAEQLVIQGFPKRIVKLNELLHTPMFISACNFTEIDQDLNIPIPDAIAVKETGADNVDDETAGVVAGTNNMYPASYTVPCNSAICNMIQIVKPIIRKQMEDTNLLKMWVTIIIPKIEDGNNFGVSIQEYILNEIKFVEFEVATFFDQIYNYLLTRAKMLSKVLKHPHIDDYRRAVVDLDGKKLLGLWLAVCKMRNHYCSLHEIIIKNMEMLKTPRSSYAENLY